MNATSSTRRSRRSAWTATGVCVLALVAALWVAAPRARAAVPPPPITHTGWIKLAHGAYNAVTATGAACDPASPLNGLDGVWYKIPAGATQATLTPNALLIADLLFRKIAPNPSPVPDLPGHKTDVPGWDCVEAGAIWGGNYGQAVSGPIPADATYVLVNGWLGTGLFSIEFSHGPVDAWGPYDGAGQCPILPVIPNAGWNCLPTSGVLPWL